jgi:hypothetical protein
MLAARQFSRSLANALAVSATNRDRPKTTSALSLADEVRRLKSIHYRHQAIHENQVEHTTFRVEVRALTRRGRTLEKGTVLRIIVD